MNRVSTTLGLALLGALALSRPGFAEDAKKDDHKGKWEEMKKMHEECLKKSGALDQKTMDAMGECHKSMKKEHDGKMEKGDHEAMKAAMGGCLKEKGITLTDAQQEAIKGCHEHHRQK